MTFVGCSVPERFVNPLFEVFDGGDFALSSSSSIGDGTAQMRIYLDPSSSGPEAEASAAAALKSALDVVGLDVPVETGELADEDWKLSYRRHFKTENVGQKLVLVPAWEKIPDGDRIPIVLDPGMAFGTGRHETTRACLEMIDGEFASDRKPESFLDMGCGSGILSIAAAKLGCPSVEGFDIDPDAVEVAIENATANGADVKFRRFALGRKNGGGEDAPSGKYDLVAANILGPLLVRFADEIAPFAANRLIVSGILEELYHEVLAAYEARGFTEIYRKTIGEWTTGLLGRRPNML